MMRRKKKHPIFVKTRLFSFFNKVAFYSCERQRKSSHYKFTLKSISQGSQFFISWEMRWNERKRKSLSKRKLIKSNNLFNWFALNMTVKWPSHRRLCKKDFLLSFDSWESINCLCNKFDFMGRRIKLNLNLMKILFASRTEIKAKEVFSFKFSAFIRKLFFCFLIRSFVFRPRARRQDKDDAYTIKL